LKTTSRNAVAPNLLINIHDYVTRGVSTFNTYCYMNTWNPICYGVHCTCLLWWCQFSACRVLAVCRESVELL